MHIGHNCHLTEISITFIIWCEGVIQLLRQGTMPSPQVRVFPDAIPSRTLDDKPKSKSPVEHFGTFREGV
jgi:hypothetical protein